MEGKVEASWSDNASIQHYSDHVTHRVAFIFCCLLSLAIDYGEAGNLLKALPAAWYALVLGGRGTYGFG